MISTPSPNVLLVTQDPVQAEEILDTLQASTFDVTWVQDDEAAINALNQGTFHALITQINAQRIDGLRMMTAAQSHRPNIVTLLIASQNDMDSSVTALQNGALDFQIPPLNMERLTTILQHGLALQDLQYEAQRLRRRLDSRYGLSNVIGQSRAIEQAYEKIRQTAPSDTPIILVGEPGTGKDHLAQAIHYASTRSTAPMVKWLCTADTLPNADIDLFGLPPNTPGLITTAHTGTLYLDSIHNLPTPLTDQLLTLQSLHTFERPGDPATQRADVRLLLSINPKDDIGTSTQHLLSELQRRFHAVTIELPPLRDRPEDIPILTDYFIQHHEQSAGKTGITISPDALSLLSQYPWPSNVRELTAVIQGMILSAPDETTLTSQHIPHTITQSLASIDTHLQIPMGSPLSDVERTMIEATMEHCRHNKEECAKILGIGLRTLYRKLKEYETG